MERYRPSRRRSAVPPADRGLDVGTAGVGTPDVHNESRRHPRPHRLPRTRSARRRGRGVCRASSDRSQLSGRSEGSAECCRRTQALLEFFGHGRAGQCPSQSRCLLEEVVPGCEKDPVGFPDRYAVFAPRQARHPAVQVLYWFGVEAGQCAGDVRAGAVAECRQCFGVHDAAVLPHLDRLAEAHRIAAVARVGGRVDADLPEVAAAVLQTGDPFRGRSPDLEGEADVGRRPYGERKPHIAREPSGAQAGAYHDACVLFAADDAEHLHSAAASGMQREDLVGDHRVTQCLGQARDRDTGADGTAVLVKHRGTAVGREQRHAGLKLGAVHGPDRYAADILQNAKSSRNGIAQGDHSILGDQFGAQPVGPLAPDRAALPCELNQAGVVVRVTEYAGLATGLPVAWNAALVDSRRRSAFGQCIGGAESDDAGSYHGHLGNPVHWIASPRVPETPTEQGWGHLSPPRTGG
ncbi:hypothetical protein SCAB_84711 [Streptomyces scabiei 87.22]|uniref:Uncharacterized protein n=1 Tax=Streptomyces scabiei (strain 87.22) TaxID=680198 RepID=C9Z032_STRSW|nr:hypothetical protein SCAB_84711 [Streptomyces scabiei 87.22]